MLYRWTPNAGPPPSPPPAVPGPLEPTDNSSADLSADPDLPVGHFSQPGSGLAVASSRGMSDIGGGFLITPLLIFRGIAPSVAVATVSLNRASSLLRAISYWRRRTIDGPLAACCSAAALRHRLGGGCSGPARLGHSISPSVSPPCCCSASSAPELVVEIVRAIIARGKASRFELRGPAATPGFPRAGPR